MSKDKELNRKIGKRLEELRKEKGVSRQWIAFRLKGQQSNGTMSEQGYGKIERGESTLNRINARRLADIHKVSVEYILCMDDDRTTEEKTMKDFTDHFNNSEKVRSFLRSLDIRRQPLVVTHYKDSVTGAELPLQEVQADSDTDVDVVRVEPPTKAGVITDNEYIETIKIGKKVYYLPADTWSTTIELIMETALASIELSCKKFNRPEVGQSEL